MTAPEHIGASVGAIMERLREARDAGVASVWSEYDSAAEWCAKRGIRGNVGDRLPLNLSGLCLNLIAEDPEAFAERIRATAYALACARTESRHQAPGA